MANRDFYFGCILTGLGMLTIQEYRGLEGSIQALRDSWIDVGFPLMATILTVSWLVYFIYRPKSETIVVKEGMEQTISLKEGDTITIIKAKANG